MSDVALLLIGAFAVLLLLGVPIYLSLGVASLVTILVFDLVPTQVIPSTIASSFQSFTLLAIPFFILAGHLLASSEMATRLVDLARALVGAARGGLAVVSVLVGIFFAGISGSGPADVGAQGAILIPAMTRDRYPKPFSSALIAANGAIGIVLPPSIGLILYGVAANVSIGRLFIAGILPGVVIALSLAGVSVYLARRHGWGPLPAPAGGADPDEPPAHPRTDPDPLTTTRRGFAQRCRDLGAAFRRAVWGLLAPIIILGGIYGGVFTPTEAAVVVVVYALFVGTVIHRDLRIRDLGTILTDSAHTTGVVMIIVASASLFAFLLNTEGIARSFAEALTSTAPNWIVLLLLVNLVVLVAGTMLDAVSIYYIFVPILLPVALTAGIDPVHFGLIMTTNLAIGQITPPVGVNLFVAAAVGDVTVAQISRSVLPILAAEFVALLVITFVPGLSLWLPDLLGI